MFNFLRCRIGKEPSKRPNADGVNRFDALNETATKIAIELIEGRGGSTYISGIKRIFKDTPTLIKDVAPEYQERLKKLINLDEA